MSEQSIRRIEEDEPEKKKKRKEPLVPEIIGEDRSNRQTVAPIVAGASQEEITAYQTVPYKDDAMEQPISSAYPAIDTDLGVDNLQNDIPEADLQDFK